MPLILILCALYLSGFLIYTARQAAHGAKSDDAAIQGMVWPALLVARLVTVPYRWWFGFWRNSE